MKARLVIPINEEEDNRKHCHKSCPFLVDNGAAFTLNCYCRLFDMYLFGSSAYISTPLRSVTCVKFFEEVTDESR
jgi:hypothetical protein